MAIPKKSTSKEPSKAAKKPHPVSKGGSVVDPAPGPATCDLGKHAPIKLPVKFEPVVGTSFPIYYPFKRSATGMVYINLSMITRVDTCPSNSELVQIGLQGQTTQLVTATLQEVMSIIGAKYQHANQPR
jgi:hypothetical protein